MFEFIKITSFLGIACVVVQISAIPTNTNPSPPSPSLKPTDPLEITKLVLEPLWSHLGNLGPIAYVLLTEPNALGHPISEITQIIAHKIPFEEFQNDVGKILDITFSPENITKALQIYDKIKDVAIEGTTNESLDDAVQIIKNITNNPTTAEEIINIIKSNKF